MVQGPHRNTTYLMFLLVCNTIDMFYLIIYILLIQIAYTVVSYRFLIMVYNRLLKC